MNSLPTELGHRPVLTVVRPLGQGHGPVKPVLTDIVDHEAYFTAAAAAWPAAAADIFLPIAPFPSPSVWRHWCVATPIVTSLHHADQSATTGQFIFLLRHASRQAIFIDWFYARDLRSADCGRIRLRNPIRSNWRWTITGWDGFVFISAAMCVTIVKFTLCKFMTENQPNFPRYLQ